MEQNLQSMLQASASVQATLVTLTWALGTAFSITFAVVVAGVKALYALKSDVSVLLQSQRYQRAEHEQQREDTRLLAEKLGHLEREFSEFKGSYGLLQNSR